MDLNAIEVMLAVIKPKHSPINLLGKLFFAACPLREQRIKIIVVGLVFGAVVTVVILVQNGWH